MTTLRPKTTLRPNWMVTTVAAALTVSAASGCAKMGTPSQVTANPAPAPPAVPPKKAQVEVPDVVGVKESQAREVIEALKLETDVRTSFSATVPAGQVISQSPKKETTVRESTTVLVRVSTGPEPGTASAQAAPERPAVTTVYVTPTPAPPRVIERPAPPVYSVGRLSDSDLYGKSRSQLDVMRNLPYARHGYRFKRGDLLNFFSQFSWYEPDTSSMSTVERRLSSTERYNVQRIQAYQQRNGMLR